MFTDAAAIGLALFAMWISSRPASVERTFGYHRTEILARAGQRAESMADCRLDLSGSLPPSQ